MSREQVGKPMYKFVCDKCGATVVSGVLPTPWEETNGKLACPDCQKGNYDTTSGYVNTEPVEKIYEDMLKSELIELATERGFDSEGTKAELIQRLYDNELVEE